MEMTCDPVRQMLQCSKFYSVVQNTNQCGSSVVVVAGQPGGRLTVTGVHYPGQPCPGTTLQLIITPALHLITHYTCNVTCNDNQYGVAQNGMLLNPLVKCA